MTDKTKLMNLLDKAKEQLTVKLPTVLEIPLTEEKTIPTQKAKPSPK